MRVNRGLVHFVYRPGRFFMSQRAARSGLMLAAVFCVEGVIAHVAHRHCHDGHSGTTASPEVVCSHGHHHRPVEPEASDSPAAPAAPTQDHDDCAACRYLALSAVWMNVEIDCTAAELVAVREIVSESLDLERRTADYAARAPPIHV